MQTAAAFIDKSKWGTGPWSTEPDRVEWVDQATGYLCLAQRSEDTGTWCGYVGVPVVHPDYGKAPEDMHAAYDLQVHGGLSYAGDYPAQQLWLFGFCCNHSYDLSPALNEIRQAFPAASDLAPRQTYRDLAYVQQECASLAQQLKDIS